jgi:hypothetical protein
VPTIDIPEVFKHTLEHIASMSDSELERVRKTLAELTPHLKLEVLSEQAKAASNINQVPDLFEIVQTLAGLSITRFRLDVPLDKFVHRVATSLQFQKDQPKTQAAFEEKLKSLLNIEPLELSTRAFDIQHEYEKVFRAARIITDIRPVFDVPGAEAIGAMIVHNLSVKYFQDGENKEILFALDDADVTALRKVLEKAEIKSKTLEQLVEKAGVYYFESR